MSTYIMNYDHVNTEISSVELSCQSEKRTESLSVNNLELKTSRVVSDSHRSTAWFFCECSILVLNRCCVTVCFWVLVSLLEGWVVGWKNLAVASYLRCRSNVSCLWTAGLIFDHTEPWDSEPGNHHQTASDYQQTSDSENRTARVNHLCFNRSPWAGKNQVSEKKLIISQHSWAGSTTQVRSMKFKSRQQQVNTGW